MSDDPTTENTSLCRETASPRPARPWPKLVAALATAAALGALWVSAHPRTHVVMVDVHREAPVTETRIVEVPVIVRVATEPKPEPEPEPKPKRSVGEPLVDEARQGPVIGVVTSRRDRNAIAVWSQLGAAVSRDGGARFEVVQPSVIGVVAAAIGRDGTAYFVSLGSESAPLTLTAVPKAKPASSWAIDANGAVVDLQAASGHLVLYTDGGSNNDYALYQSSDGGRSWTSRTVPSGNFENQLVVGDDESLQLLIGSEAGCGGGSQDRYTSSLSEREWRDAPWPVDIPVGVILGPGGWAYGIDGECSDGGPAGLCAIGPKASRSPTNVLKTDESSHVGASAANRRIALAVIDQKLVRLRRGSARVVAKVPGELDSLSVDAAGRAVAIVNGYVVRWSAETGWRSLFPSRASMELAELSYEKD